MTRASRYLGLQLAHPIVASASPLTATFDGMRQLEDAGAAAVVMASCRAIENSMLRPVNSEVPIPISASPAAVEQALASKAA